MGCDIHFHVERQTEDGWRAVPVPAPFLDAWMPGWIIRRNYRLFDVLSGVRCRLESYERRGVGHYVLVRTIDPKHAHALSWPGLPSGLSIDVRQAADKWEGDAHNYSHASLRELMDERIAHAGGCQWASLLAEMTTVADGDLDGVRAVWWFDN